MDFLELAKSRKSIRNYKAEDVPDEMVTKLLEAAQSAPSGGNCQSWHFYIIRDKTIKTQIRERSCRQSSITDAPVLIIVCADIQRSAGRYAERGRSLYCIQDTAAAIQNILLCATSLGLGTCWCGAFDECSVSEILNLDKDMRPVAMIPVGYFSDDTAKTSRRPIEEIATFL